MLMEGQANTLFKGQKPFGITGDVADIGLCSKNFMENIEKMKQLPEPLASTGLVITLIAVIKTKTIMLSEISQVVKDKY